MTAPAGICYVYRQNNYATFAGSENIKAGDRTSYSTYQQVLYN